MSLANPTPSANGGVSYDVHAFLAALKDADLVQVSWSEGDQRKGLDVFLPPLREHPNTLALGVRNKKQAFALRSAKIEIDNGNYYAAYLAMREFAEPAPATTH